MLSNKNAKRYAQKFWPEGRRKTRRDMEGIKDFYYAFNDDENGDIDEQSFSDLTLDSLYAKMDGTYSTSGETKLYEMLKKPVRDKEVLEKRSKVMEYFGTHEEERVNIQSILYGLGNDKQFNFKELLINEHKGDKQKKTLYFILGRVAPILIILFLISRIFYNPNPVHTVMGFLAIIILLIANSAITNRERGTSIFSKANKKPLQGIFYAGKLVKTAIKISSLNIEALDEYKADIDEVFKKLGPDVKKLQRASGSFANNTGVSAAEPLLELIDTFVLGVENSYYGMIDKLNDNKENLIELYGIIGEIDALIAVEGYKEHIGYESTKPEFIENSEFKIVDGAHPLVENVVRNSITIDKKGIVLTGTNMSGKSTFLRMIGINIVLAQSFNFVHAKEYKSDFLNYVSSISPEDDVENGKSYYIAEAEAVLRVINALKGKYKVFCGIDEIFRGTNPIERIAASEQILEYIQKRNSLSIVATHDKELTEKLIKTHDFYHFEEAVSESEGLTFDYKLKEGVLKTRNAIKLLNYIGYPKEIVNGAYDFIDSNESN